MNRLIVKAKHYDIFIFGEVQGVSFRYFSRQEADRLGISGFIRNEPDGSIYIEAEGKEKELHKFIQWCKNGPPIARVNRVEARNGTFRGYKNFEIRH